MASEPDPPWLRDAVVDDLRLALDADGDPSPERMRSLLEADYLNARTLPAAPSTV